MNSEGLGVSFSAFLLFLETFSELGANFAENVASPSIATEQAASDRLMAWPTGCHNTSSAYYQDLMSVELRTAESLRKKHRRIGPGLRRELDTANFRELRKTEVQLRRIPLPGNW